MSASFPPRRRRLALRGATVAVAAALAACATAPAALAARDMQIGVADDGSLFGRPAAVQALVRGWKAAGVDVVRVSVPWSGVAPAPRRLTAPAGFPNGVTDPRWDWTFMDPAIKAVRGAGIAVQLALIGPAPWWASDSPRRHDGRWLPSSRAYAQFAAAVAARYHGQVAGYILWNEPNQPVALKPQSAAPDRYRDLVDAASAAIRAQDSRGKILIGALASTDLTAGGNHHEGTSPLPFLRRMACVDARYRPIRTGACRHFVAPAADGIVLHPHGLKQPPTTPSRNSGFATISDLRRFEGVVDRLTAARRLRVAGGGRFPIYLGEFGYQTNPPDRGTGVSYATQALWLAQGAQIAWRDPRVRDLNWYVWRDQTRSGAWDSGLYDTRGAAKPSRTAFALPFLASRRAVWGQVRPDRASTVTIQGHGRRGGWRTLATVRTDAWGGFQRGLRVPRGIVLVRARAAGGPTSLTQRV